MSPCLNNMRAVLSARLAPPNWKVTHKPSDIETIGLLKSRSFLSWCRDKRLPGSYELTRQASATKPSKPASEAASLDNLRNIGGIGGQGIPLIGSSGSYRYPVLSVTQPTAPQFVIATDI